MHVLHERPLNLRCRRIHHREAPEAVAEGRADAAIVYYHLALRYTRIFPDRFDIPPLGGTETNPEPPPENLTAEIHMGLIRDGGYWGAKLMAFMQGETVARVYARHGLLHRRDIPKWATSPLLPAHGLCNF